MEIDDKALTDPLIKVPEMDLEWSDLSVVLAICRGGSLSGAARTLGVNHSTVFRRINLIEARSGVRFFERLPSGYVMTDAGSTTMRYAERIEKEVLALGREILGRDMRLQGKIRVTAPEGVATVLMPPLLSDFCTNNPDISIDLIVTSTSLDLARREADIALRVTDNPPETMLGRRICAFRFCIYASPRYLDKHRNRSLQEHDWIMTLAEIDWLVPIIWENKALANRSIVLACSMTTGATNAALQDMGVVLLPCFRGDSHPGLVRVTEPLEELTMELWVLTHPDLRYTARIKALFGYLYESLLKQRDLIEGNAGGKRHASADNR